MCQRNLLFRRQYWIQAFECHIGPAFEFQTVLACHTELLGDDIHGQAHRKCLKKIDFRSADKVVDQIIDDLLDTRLQAHHLLCGEYFVHQAAIGTVAWRVVGHQRVHR
ncbi:hypothetical protein D3C85_1645160 [compost metagenome]